MSRARWLAVAVVGLAALAAVAGGEYGTGDWLALRRQVREEQLRLAELQRTVDSLERVATALERDPRAQERAAREAFGMIREGEHLYRFVAPGE